MKLKPIKEVLIDEIMRDRRNRNEKQNLETLNEYQLQEVLSDLVWQVREDI